MCMCCDGIGCIICFHVLPSCIFVNTDKTLRNSLFDSTLEATSARISYAALSFGRFAMILIVTNSVSDAGQIIKAITHDSVISYGNGRFTWGQPHNYCS